MTSAVILGMIVTMFPRAARAGQGDRRVRVRRLGRRLGRPARRRRAHAGDRLALDLLRQHPDRDRHDPVPRGACSRDEPGIGSAQGADIPGAVLITGALMLGVYTIVKPAAEDGWGARSDAVLGAGSPLLLAAFLAREATAREAADAAAHLPLALAHAPAPTWSRSSRSRACSAIFFLGALYLRRVLGYDALQIGLAFLPMTIAMGSLSIRFSERIYHPLRSAGGAARRVWAWSRPGWRCSRWPACTPTT